MSEQSVGNRWWENYLVRYFLPSVAGMIIIRWLEQNTYGELTNYIPPFLLSDWKDFGTAHLIVWMLFGTLYCYLASYPILVFHATRVLDFKDISGNVTRLWCNPYIATIAFSAIAYISAWQRSLCLAFIAVGIFSFIQIYRLYKAYSIQGSFGFKKGYEASIVYAYLNKLSKRRSVTNESITETDEDARKGKTTTSNHDKDLSESYKHLREHGNTAFIFLLELALCPILFVAIEQENGRMTFSFLAAFLIIWIIPSVLVHWVGQHLERRYSWFKW